METSKCGSRKVSTGYRVATDIIGKELQERIVYKERRTAGANAWILIYFMLCKQEIEIRG